MQCDFNQLGLLACLQLQGARGLGNLTFGRLMEAFGSAENALQQDIHSWQQLGLSEKIYRSAQKSVSSSTLKTIEKWLSQSSNHHIIGYDCSYYPDLLKKLIDPPAILYAAGNINVLELKSIAMVGSRQATPFGLKTTQKFAYQLASQGLSICSGLALGIDASAHLGALSANGGTVAFVGTGVDIIYPKTNEKIAQEMIQKNGLLVSEFPLGTPPKANNFPPRNRLICGLSSYGVIVVESKAKGGSMITARLANEQGKDVFAVPGSIQSPLSEGCHLLIQQGAKLVQNTTDILQELNFSPSSGINTSIKDSPGLTSSRTSIQEHPQHIQILAAMNYEIIRTEEIANFTKLTVDVLSTALLELELQGKIKSLSGNRWQRVC
jgi:DNA processing protein